LRQLTLAVLALTLAVGCETQQPQSALHARITLEPTQKVTCVVMQVDSPSGQRLSEKKLERVEGKNAFSVAIFRGAFPEEIRISAHPRYGTGCADPLFPNGESATQTARFPSEDSAEVTLALSGPTPANDVDRDGFAGEAAGGPDCDDGDLNAYPGAPESCTGGIDLNCNRKIGCQDPVCADQVCSDPPAAIAFTSAPQRLVADTCSAAVTVQARSASNTPRVVPAATQVALMAPSEAGVTLYSDASCGTQVSSVTIEAGASDATFYFKATVADSVTLTATVAGVTPATQAQTIDPRPASALVFRSAAQTIPAGQCSGRVSLRTEDPLGNASPLTSTTSVGLSATPAAGFTFYSDAGCTTSLSSVLISSGASAASFYFRGTSVGTVTVTANAGGGFAPVTQSAVIQPGPAAALKFTSAAKLVTVNACSTRVDFRVEDSSGNPAPVSTAASVTLTGPPSVTFYSDATCATPISSVTIAASEGQGAFYFRPTATGSASITLSASGLSPDTQAQTIVAAGPTTLVFVNAPATQRADQCSGAITVQSRDSFNNPSSVSANTTVTLGANPSSGVTFYSNSGCSTVITSVQINNNANTSGSFYVRATQAGSVSLSGTSAPLAPAAHDMTVSPAPPSALEFTTSAHTATAGQCSPAVTLRTRDQYGNTSPVLANAVINLSASPSTDFTFHTDADCATAAVTQFTIPAGQSTGTFYFSGRRGGSVSVTANGTGAGLGTQSQSHTIAASAPTKLAITSGAQSRAAGQCSAAVSVRTEDAYGNLSPISSGATVNLGANPEDGFAFYSDSNCTTAVTQVIITAGASSAQPFYWSGTKAGAVEISASSDPLVSAVQGQTITAAPGARLVITSAAQSVPAGQCSEAATVQLQDQYGNPTSPASNLTVTLADNLPNASAFTFHTSNACSGGGVSSVQIGTSATTQIFYFKGTQAGPVLVTVSSGSLTPDSQQQTILPGAPNKIAFITGPHTVRAFECSPANTLQIRDVNNNASPVAEDTNVALSHNGTGVTFHTASDCAGAGVSAVTVSSGQPEVTFYFRATSAQSFTLTATASGLPNPTATQTETITVGAPYQLRITAGPTSHSADANCSALLTVQLQDQGGTPTNATENTTVTLTSNASPTSNFTFFSDSACTAAVTSVQITSGTNSRNFYFRARTAELVTITASNPSLGEDRRAVTINPGAAKVLKITSAPQTGLVVGTCSPQVTFQTRDQWENVANVTTNTTVGLSDNPDFGTAFKFYSNSGCTTEISSVQVASGSSTGSFYFMSTRSGSVSVQINATNYTGDSQLQAIVPGAASRLNFVTAPQSITPNTCSAITSVEVVDQNGNRVTTTNYTVELTGSAAAGMTFYENASCANPARTSVSTVEGVASFYWKATGSGTATITATSAPLEFAQQDQILGKLVKSGTCTIADNDADGVQACPIPAADTIASLNRAILFWQATGTNAGADQSSVMCYFESTSSITCARTATGSGSGVIDIVWYVVEFPASSGVYVEHRSPANLPVTCTSTSSLEVMLNQTVNASRSFVLISSRRGGNSSQTSIYKRALLANDGTKVTITSSGCAGGGGEPVALQIVDFPGAVVSRGTVTLGSSTATTSATGLPTADLSRTFLLYTMEIPAGAANQICQRSVRGYLSGNTRVDFSRGNGSACTFADSIQLSYERVLLPAGNRVMAFNEPLASGAASASRTINAVDLLRSVAFTGGQAVSGQSMGETSATGDNPNTARARLRLTDSTTLQFQRSNTAEAAQFTGYVVEFVSP
jgi:hypothetical protein